MPNDNDGKHHVTWCFVEKLAKTRHLLKVTFFRAVIIVIKPHHHNQSLTTKLSIDYNFYIEGRDDMKSLLTARGFKEDEWNFDTPGFFVWIRDYNQKKSILKISERIFDDERKLKFIRNSDWESSYVSLEEVENEIDEEPPF